MKVGKEDHAAGSELRKRDPVEGEGKSCTFALGPGTTGPQATKGLSEDPILGNFFPGSFRSREKGIHAYRYTVCPGG